MQFIFLHCLEVVEKKDADWYADEVSAIPQLRDYGKLRLVTKKN